MRNWLGKHGVQILAKITHTSAVQCFKTEHKKKRRNEWDSQVISFKRVSPNHRQKKRDENRLFSMVPAFPGGRQIGGKWNGRIKAGWRRNNEREYKDGRERKSSCINLDVDASRLGLIRKWRFHGKTSRGHISSFKYREKAKEITEKIRFALIAFLDMDTYFGSTADCIKIWIFCLFCVYQCYYPVRTFLFFFLKDFCIRKFLLLEIAAICCS